MIRISAIRTSHFEDYNAIGTKAVSARRFLFGARKDFGRNPRYAHLRRLGRLADHVRNLRASHSDFIILTLLNHRCAQAVEKRQKVLLLILCQPHVV